LLISAASSSAREMPAVGDQNPTTGTRAIERGVGVGTFVGLDWGVDDAVVVAVGVGFGSGVGDGCVGAQDVTMVAIATTPIHRRAMRVPRKRPA
jgi:hypothetical protein